MQHMYMCLRRLHGACTRLTKHFKYGEYVLASHGDRSKLFKLQEDAVYNTSVGHLAHKDIVGQQVGKGFADSSGRRVKLRRACLAEYVCLMKRGPTPMYPKDIWTVLGLMDIGQGACVLEAGSGSGSLTLHLSRAGKLHNHQMW